MGWALCPPLVMGGDTADKCMELVLWAQHSPTLGRWQSRDPRGQGGQEGTASPAQRLCPCFLAPSLQSPHRHGRGWHLMFLQLLTKQPHTRVPGRLCCPAVQRFGTATDTCFAVVRDKWLSPTWKVGHDSTNESKPGTALPRGPGPGPVALWGSPTPHTPAPGSDPISHRTPFCSVQANRTTVQCFPYLLDTQKGWPLQRGPHSQGLESPGPGRHLLTSHSLAP